MADLTPDRVAELRRLHEASLVKATSYAEAMEALAAEAALSAELRHALPDLLDEFERLQSQLRTALARDEPGMRRLLLDLLAEAEVRAETAEAERDATRGVAASIDSAHIERQRTWSMATFGPGTRTRGVIDHIRKELIEVEADPADLGEWVDVVILALDGAWRAGWEPQQIIDAVRSKQARNEARTWPDWRARSEDEAIEHDRSAEPVIEAIRDDRSTTS